MIPLFKTAMSDAAGEGAARVLGSGYVGQGAAVEEFEAGLRRELDYPHLVTTNSATSALTLALHMMALPPGTKVLTTALTCTATNFAILANHLIPVWCDVDPETLNICPRDVRSKIDAGVGAIMVVHWGGYPVDMDELAAIKEEYKSDFNRDLHIVEDCAHAWGSSHRGRSLGTFGDYAAYSFGPIKSLSCGDGGALLLPDADQTERARRLRWFGIDRSFRGGDIPEYGFKYHMNDVNAAIGLANLELSRSVVSRHRSNSEFYDQRLAGADGVRLMGRHPDRVSSCWLYTLLADRRDDLVRKLRSAGIESGQVHARNDLYTCVREFTRPLPVLDSVYGSILCIPCGWWIGDEDRNKIVDAIKGGW